ncbi:hypothetical protein TWF718_002248 [Orbilia javanica]|uniref:Clr5 domain-containing protein n=1 Tax=Orbilia javanica TaxID=47235 RepID=A0AAN8MN34_9PEZI
MTYDWEKHKETLYGLYQDRMTYKEIREHMVHNYSFKASINSYKEMFKKQWGWDKYVRGATAGGSIVKRRSRSERQTVGRNRLDSKPEFNDSSIPQEPQYTLPRPPNPEDQGHDNEEEERENFENEDLAGEPFQSTANIRGTWALEPTNLEHSDVHGEDPWPYFQNSPKWWEHEGSPVCLWQPPYQSPNLCRCDEDFGIGGCYGYLRLPEKLRLLKSFGLISLLPPGDRAGFRADMLYILSTTIKMMETCYGKTTESAFGALEHDIWKLVRLLRRATLKRRERRPLDILHLGHLTFTLTLPILVFTTHDLSAIVYIRNVASLFFDLLVRAKAASAQSSLPPHILESLSQGRDDEDTDTLPDWMPLHTDGLISSYWAQYIHSNLRVRLSLHGDPVKHSLQQFGHHQRGRENAALLALGIKALSEEEGLIDSVYSMLHHKKGDEIGPHTHDMNANTQHQIKSDIAMNWPRETPEELKQPAIATLARTTKLLADNYKKIASPQIVFEIYDKFHRMLLTTSDVYPEAIANDDVDAVLCEFSTFCIHNGMHDQEAAIFDKILKSLEGRLPSSNGPLSPRSSLRLVPTLLWISKLSTVDSDLRVQRFNDELAGRIDKLYFPLIMMLRLDPVIPVWLEASSDHLEAIEDNVKCLRARTNNDKHRDIL